LEEAVPWHLRPSTAGRGYRTTREGEDDIARETVRQE
jgi:hypothetical protein